MSTPVIPLTVRTDRFQGYRGRAKAVFEQYGIGVWSEVEIVNDRGSVFVGVVLPRSENAAYLHIVVKLFNGPDPSGVATRWSSGAAARHGA